MAQVGKHGLIEANKRRLMCLSMFWHFLDVIWIGVFTFVYLLGVLQMSDAHAAHDDGHARRRTTTTRHRAR